MKTKKKRSSLRFSPFFCPNSKGGHGSILHTILRYSYITGDPKGGGGAWYNAPPKYAPGAAALRQ